jgi:hypothetical protein
VNRARAALYVAAAGLLVGLVVAVVSVATGTSLCGAGEAGADCFELVRKLAVRTGVVAGLAVMIMGVLVAGLLKMLSQDEKQRAERAMEAYLASRGREAPSEE